MFSGFRQAMTRLHTWLRLVPDHFFHFDLTATPAASAGPGGRPGKTTMNPTLLKVFGSARPALRSIAAMALLACGTAHADYVWLQRDGDRVAAHAGELHQPLAALPALREARSLSPNGKATTLQPQGAAFVLPTSGGDQRFVAMLPAADGVLTYYQARFGRQEIQAFNDLELVPTEPGGSTFRLFFKGQPVAASQVNVETSEGWRRVLTPAKDGSVSFTPSFPGLYVLEVTAKVNGGTAILDGKTYSDVRYTATLSFEVAAR